MNEFLQTLRSGVSEKHRSPMTRKSYDQTRKNCDQTIYNPAPRYPYSTRSVPSFMPPNRLAEDAPVRSPLQNAIEHLNNQIYSLSKYQERMIDAQEKTADMLERQVYAIEKILDHLNVV